MIKIGRILSLFAMVTGLAAAEAKPIQVAGTVDRNEMGVGDTFTFSIEISSDSSLNVSDPRLPNLAGFELLNQWSGVESRSTFSNGTFEVVQSRSFNYMLSAQQAGTHVLGPATVVVEGQAYSTQPITITVLEGRQAPPQAQNQQNPPDTMEDIDDIFNQLLKRRMGQDGTRTQPVNPDDAFFIQVEVDKKKAYVGEQVTASWYLYTRGQIHDIDTLKYPSLSGFWKEEIELATRLNFQQEVVNGIPYQRALLASYALFPIKAGKSTVDPYKAKCTVSVPSNFGFSRPYQFTKASQPISLDVVDVPSDGRPANFTGAVGQFSARAEVAQSTTVAHQPLSLKYKIEGRGNAKLIDLPPLNLPPGIEVYDTKFEAKFFREGNSFKEFEIVLIPRQAGSITIPAISSAAFDPKTTKFYEFSTQPVVLNVLPGVAPAAGPVAEATKEKVADEIKLPDLVLTLDADRSVTHLPQGMLWTVLYALVLATLAWRLLTEGDFIHRKRDLQKMVQARAKRVRAFADSAQWRKVGAEGANLVYFVLGELSGTGGAGLELDKLMLKAPPSVRREMTDPIRQLLAELELLSFAPENLVGQRKEVAALRSLVERLDKLMRQAVKLSEQSTESEEPSEAKT